MLRRYRKIEVDSRFSAAEDRGHYSICGDSAAKLSSFIFLYLLLTPSIYKASKACESCIIYIYNRYPRRSDNTCAAAPE